MESNYKAKYLALRMKFMESVDQAFRLGYEQGAQDAQLDQMAQQQQAQDAAMQGGDPNDPNAEPGQEGQEGQDPNDPNAQAAEGQEGSELDSHINELQQAVGGAQGPAKEEIQKALNGLIAFKAKRDQSIQLKKSDKAIKAISKALKPKFSVSAKNNLNSNAHKSLNMQEKIVSDVMKAWDKETANTSKTVAEILNVDNLIKKD